MSAFSVIQMEDAVAIVMPPMNPFMDYAPIMPKTPSKPKYKEANPDISAELAAEFSRAAAALAQIELETIEELNTAFIAYDSTLEAEMEALTASLEALTMEGQNWVKGEDGKRRRIE